MSVLLVTLALATGRFAPSAPLPGLPSVVLDSYGNGVGVAQLMARSKGLQARILWVDGTANLARCSTAEGIDDLVSRAARAGFTTLVYDVKPIVGYTLYPSKLAPKLEEWRGQRMPRDWDPLAAMARAAKMHRVELLVALNAFSEGHRFTGTGPGYATPELQTVQMETTPALAAPGGRLAVHPSPNPAQWPQNHVAVFEPARLPGALRSRAVFVDRLGRAVPSAERAVAAYVAPEGVDLPTPIRVIAEATFVPAAQAQRQWPLMMNPHLEAVRARPLEFVREILASYDVRGVVFDDRLRYAGLEADFSEAAKAEFERSLGARLSWPRDVFEYTYTVDLKRGVRPGPYWDAWLAFRARTLRDWVAEARRTVDALKPGTLLGVYQGSWYGDYARYGSNWASPNFEAGFPFLTGAYRASGFASQLDLIMVGAYYKVPTIVEAMASAAPTGQTVEAAGQIANRAVRDQAWTYAGIMLMDYADDSAGLARALQAACGSSQGVMVFDLSHGIDRYWDLFARAFRVPARPPHAEPGALRAVRRLREAKDRRGDREPAPILYEGQPGAGF